MRFRRSRFRNCWSESTWGAWRYACMHANTQCRMTDVNLRWTCEVCCRKAITIVHRKRDVTVGRTGKRGRKGGFEVDIGCWVFSVMITTWRELHARGKKTIAESVLQTIRLNLYYSRLSADLLFHVIFSQLKHRWLTRVYAQVGSTSKDKTGDMDNIWTGNRGRR